MSTHPEPQPPSATHQRRRGAFFAFRGRESRSGRRGSTSRRPHRGKSRPCTNVPAAITDSPKRRSLRALVPPDAVHPDASSGSR
jgi:hypothetical protein